MLGDNIKTLRRQKGLSQQELALRLHVVRQTVSKWEQGLSVPDADLLPTLSEALDTSVGALLGETAAAAPDDLQDAVRRLDAIHAALHRRSCVLRRAACWLLGSICTGTIILLAVLLLCGESAAIPQSDSIESVVLSTAFHAAVWLFVRLAPFILTGAAAGFCLIVRKGRNMSSV